MDTLKSIARRAMLDNNLQPEFTAAALQEAHAADEQPAAAVRDLRHLLWSSIDNDDSRDLDQLTFAEQLPGDSIKVLVAIADVDALVAAGSAIDAHARANTTSVYTAAQIFPMLPERLSTDLTSLNEGEERLALVIEMTIDPRGDVAASTVHRARVFNRAKLAYNSVAAWLDGEGPMPERVRAVTGMAEQLRLQDQAATRLRELRKERGALSFETIEARPVFKEETLTDIRADQRNRAKDLIEGFMVSANGVVAQFLTRSGRLSLRRVLRAPERWPRIVDLARQHGNTLPDAPDAIALNRFLAECREHDPNGFADVSLSVIKLLGAGEYAVDVPHAPTAGHFGLAVSEYTHSTAPNRRLTDLIVQRVLKAALSDAREPYSHDELQSLATHCNEQARNASKVERTVRKAATALLLAPRVGERFHGVVTGASAKGTWIRIRHPVAEGKIVRGAGGLDVGDCVTVQLVGVDPARGFIDFAHS